MFGAAKCWTKTPGITISRLASNMTFPLPHDLYFWLELSILALLKYDFSSQSPPILIQS